MRTSLKTVQGTELATLEIKTAQGEFGRLHRAVLVLLVLAQEQEVLAKLVLGETGWIALEVFGQLAQVADVLLFGGQPIIF